MGPRAAPETWDHPRVQHLNNQKAANAAEVLG